VLIGNAVHQLHPVAGQGFNLGLRDVVELANTLNSAVQQTADIGAVSLLNAYAHTRTKDQTRTIGFTDSLVKIFSNDWLAIAAARNVGLTVLDHLPFAKAILARQAMGFAE
jgi:2-octaprenyl-6-methoxyphenol hydroxylase